MSLLAPQTSPTSIPSTPTSLSGITEVSETSKGTKCRHCIDFDTDPKDDLSRPLHGWPELAKTIEKYPDFEAFPRFRDLNIKSLLYYQCQLSQLREELHEIEWMDHRENPYPCAHNYNSRADSLISSAGYKDEKMSVAREQIEKVEEIRVVLEKYNSALLQYSQVNELPKADVVNVNSLHHWLMDPKLGKNTIGGPGAESWGKLERNSPAPESLLSQFLHLFKSRTLEEDDIKLDLVVPRKCEKVDGLTLWVAHKWIPFWHNLPQWSFKLSRSSSSQSGASHEHDVEDRCSAEREKGVPSRTSLRCKMSRWCGWPKPHELVTSNEETSVQPTLDTYSMNSMLRFTSFVATVVACLLPTVAITVLSTVHTTAMLLGFIALFTAIFAIGLMSLTNPGTSRTEIFTATAAFSAVLVVFVQNQSVVSTTTYVNAAANGSST